MLYFSLDDGQGKTKYAHQLQLQALYGNHDGLFKQLVIRDFLIRDPNRGYGSLLLRESLLHISQLFGVKTKIVGQGKSSTSRSFVPKIWFFYHRWKNFA